MRLLLRAYPQAAARLVEADVLFDPGSPFPAYVDGVADYIFAYLTGVNAAAANLTGARTAPFTVRPPVPGVRENWVGAMALAPSKWPPASAPPAPVAQGVSVRSFGGVVVAAVPVTLAAPPTTDADFLAAYRVLVAALPKLPVPGRWAVNASSPLSPSYNYYYTQRYGGTEHTIEASAEVYHTM